MRGHKSGYEDYLIRTQIADITRENSSQTTTTVTTTHALTLSLTHGVTWILPTELICKKIFLLRGLQLSIVTYAALPSEKVWSCRGRVLKNCLKLLLILEQGSCGGVTVHVHAVAWVIRSILLKSN